ncbi:unnamed protein product [Leuciscus chuanchicus]
MSRKKRKSASIQPARESAVWASGRPPMARGILFNTRIVNFRKGNPNCLPFRRVIVKVPFLKLQRCNVTGEGCGYLASALCSNPSHLRELNLSWNHLGDSGLKMLSDLLEDPNYTLNKLKLQCCKMTGEGCGYLASALCSNPSHLRELDLSLNLLGDSGLKMLSDLLKDPNCTLNKLKLQRCDVTEEGCGYLASALCSNPTHLRELDLSDNHLRDAGLKMLSDLLKDPNCTLNKLELRYCDVTGEGCGYLASALCSNPSHLRELNLSWNHLGDAGLKILSDLLKDPNCTLNKLKLWDCDVTEEGCGYLASALCSNPSHLRVLDLSSNHLQDSGLKILSDLLKDPNYALNKLDTPRLPSHPTGGGAETRGKEARKGNEDAQIRNEKHPGCGRNIARPD